MGRSCAHQTGGEKAVHPAPFVPVAWQGAQHAIRGNCRWGEAFKFGTCGRVNRVDAHGRTSFAKCCDLVGAFLGLEGAYRVDDQATGVDHVDRGGQQALLKACSLPDIL